MLFKIYQWLLSCLPFLALFSDIGKESLDSFHEERKYFFHASWHSQLCTQCAPFFSAILAVQMVTIVKSVACELSQAEL